MEPATIQGLVVQLLLAVQALSGYAAPAAPPTVEFLPHQQLEQRACSGPCAVFGWFPPGQTVYLDDRLDPVNDLRSRAVLLHELVHFLQQENEAFKGPASCRTWLDKEREAFDIERRWLQEQPKAAQLASRGPRVPLQALCRDEPASQAQARPLPRSAARFGH